MPKYLITRCWVVEAPDKVLANIYATHTSYDTEQIEEINDES